MRRRTGGRRLLEAVSSCVERPLPVCPLYSAACARATLSLSLRPSPGLSETLSLPPCMGSGGSTSSARQSVSPYENSKMLKFGSPTLIWAATMFISRCHGERDAACEGWCWKSRDLVRQRLGTILEAPRFAFGQHARFDHIERIEDRRSGDQHLV